jgi:predicted NUDIX family NTP pyrophosphohydrolase
MQDEGGLLVDAVHPPCLPDAPTSGVGGQADSMARLPSAGLLLYRRTDPQVEVLLGHMGGPFWAKKDAGAWSIPKGEYADDEDPLAAARREFEEELGTAPPDEAAYQPLGDVRQRGGKVVTVWAVEGDLDASTIVSNTFEMEWPPKSGRRQAFPEIDRADWFDLASARPKVVGGQVEFLDRLSAKLG